MDLGLRFFVCVLALAFFNNAYAEETDSTDTRAPVYEPITQDISGRLERIEKVLDNRALLDMLDLLESLKTEVSSLRGEIEVQTHTVEQLKQKQRELYTDIDRRLQRFESNKAAVKSSNELEVLETTANQVVSGTEAPSGEQGLIVETDSDLIANAASEENTLAGNNATDSATENIEKEIVDPQKAEAVYQRAFNLLKESQYDQAEKAFKEFLSVYPNSAFSDNAQYWLGETNYVMQKYDIAINEYQTLLNTFPNSKKVSHALLKIGYSYAELGNAADAEKTLTEVMKQYPGTTAARLADERLRKISAAKESNT
jgi:tol-pal system protein YbgF